MIRKSKKNIFGHYRRIYVLFGVTVVGLFLKTPGKQAKPLLKVKIIGVEKMPQLNGKVPFVKDEIPTILDWVVMCYPDVLGCPWYLVNGLFHPYTSRLDTSRK